jgi:hypothetical protein
VIPFGREAFLGVFQRYNEAIWPLQIGLLLLSVAALTAAVRDTPRASWVAAWSLVVLWVWMGVGYHWLFFTDINPAAWAFGALFVVQAGLFAAAAIRGALRFGRQRGASPWLGGACVGYALVVYPLLAQLGDHPFPRSPTFGLPCPTTIFTFGLLLLTTRPVWKGLLVVPALWAALGTTAAFSLGIREDLGLGLAALVGMIALALRDRRPAFAAQVRPAAG